MNNAEKFRTVARPIGFILCILTLCILAVFQAAGAAEVPAWALAILVPIASEWLIERAVRKNKGEK